MKSENFFMWGLSRSARCFHLVISGLDGAHGWAQDGFLPYESH